MPADAGIRFGQYVLLRRIARGGMAEVFLAQQRGLEGFDRRVAVKRILPHLADSQDFVKMFFGEAKLAAQLSHPNVVHIYEFGKVENDYFIAMEFVDGVHAGQLFKHGEKEKLSATLIARIGADAANALHYAHELRGHDGKLYGLVHRDVSPANLMISFDGVVKLCDFGIAKAAAAGDQLTNPGQVKGKYAYMSPEQTIAAPLDGRSDVFSLAIVMWELLSGKVIVPRGDAIEAMRAIRDGKLEPIEKAAPGIPPTLAKAINWALEPKREKRATASDFAQALEAFIKSSPELATSMHLGNWIRGRFTRENTDQERALGPGTGVVGVHGTQAAPGTAASPSTLAAPGTASSPGAPALPGAAPSALPARASAPSLPPTPPVYPPRRVVRLVTDSGEGTEIYSASSDLDDESAQTIKGPRKSPFAKYAAENAGQAAPSAENETMRAPARAGTDDATLFGPPPQLGEVTQLVRKAPVAPDEEDSQNVFETIVHDRKTPVPSGPTVVPPRLHEAPGPSPSGVRPLPLPLGVKPSNPLIPTPGAMIGAPGSQPYPVLPAALPMPLSGAHARLLSESQRGRTMPLPSEAARRRRQNRIIAVAALGSLALLSFAIALAASRSKPAAKAESRQDADAVVVMARIDGAVQPIVVPIEPEPVDAAVAPTVPDDAAAAGDTEATAGEAYLEVRTIPDGGTVTVGDQVRVATAHSGNLAGKTAQLVLQPGDFDVVAELTGYQPEKRRVRLMRGEHQKIEIAFTKKIEKRPDRGPAMGRLSVRTTPWSDVYSGGKKLGQAPFADVELAAGTYTLTFKNPSRRPVTKTVKIGAGKPTKLNFNLP